MKFQSPPRHRIDAPIIFVHPADDAWDTDKVKGSEDEHGDDCPFLSYHRGDTRFDLAASGEHGSANALLSGTPVEYHLRRLSALQLNEVQGLLERDLMQGSPMGRMGYLQAARYGLSSIKQGGAELLKLQSPGNLSTPDVEALAQATELGIELLRHIGQAVYQASQPLRDDEKKP